LTLVDSEPQIERVQQLDGTRASIPEFVANTWANARVLTFEAFEQDQRAYDFILCANVLPIVPDAKMRARALRQIASHLNSAGECLFVCQYRNSYFKALPSFAGARPHLDGWAVLRSGESSSYYGTLPNQSLESLLRRFGFAIHASWLEGQSAYVLGVFP
jgi:hypothetical protein